MIKKFALALSMTTFCVNVDSTYAVPKSKILDMDLYRGITVKRKLQVKRKNPVQRKLQVKRKLWSEGLVERRIKTRIARKTRAERLAERRKTINAPRKVRGERFVARKTSLGQKKWTRFETMIGRPSRRMRMPDLGIRAVFLRKSVAVAPRKFHIRPFLVQIISGMSEAPLKPVVIKKVEQEKSYEHLLSYGGGTNNYKNLENQQDNVKKPLKLVQTYPASLEGQIANNETLQGGGAFYKPEETPKPFEMTQHIHATPYLGQDTPTPIDDELTLKGKENVLFAQSTTPFIEITPSDGGTPTVNLSKKKDIWSSWSAAEDEDSSEEFPFNKKFQVNQSGSQPQSPYSTPGSNRIRFTGRDLEGSLDDKKNITELKPKIPTLPLGSSPNAIRVKGVVVGTGVRSGSSSSEDSPSRFRAKKIPLQPGLESVIEEPENELTLTTLQTKLKLLVGLEVLRLPEKTGCINAADSFCKLRASIEGTGKTAVPGELAKELPLLLTSIEKYLPKMEQDQLPSPGRALIENANVRYVDNWLNELYRLNELKSDK